MERHLIFAKEGYWLTQSDKNPHRPRVFFKSIPVKHPEAWVNWSDEKYKEYCKEHGPMTKEKLMQYFSNFDYSKEKGFWGDGGKGLLPLALNPLSLIKSLKNKKQIENTEQ